MSAVTTCWRVLWRHRLPIDPDYGGAPAVMTLWLDNLDGLMLGMDIGDGAHVAVLPLPVDAADDLAAALHEHRTTARPRGES